MMVKTYTQLIQLPTFEERFEYLKLSGSIGDETFGTDRYLNQLFYSSPEWKKFRREIIIRDNACDLGIEDRPISQNGQLLIHHMNPVTKQQILDRDPILMDPEYVITVRKNPTHQAIHYGDASLLICANIVERKPGDTCLWR